MWQAKIIAERRYGITRCLQARVFDRDLSAVLSMFGLDPSVGALIKLTAPHAQAVLEALLWKDLAYSVEIMPLEKAAALAHEFVNSGQHENTQYFSNADWSLYFNKTRGFSFTGFTESTFDGGVIAIGGGFASCVWVEDED
jgi:hypothetical protein